ncbi:MAG TPA: hypothetical protein PKE47_11910, partial [Verrucomicrobiota bacterium]|nr:hypothetical protein [Verrucomicrobiota bacterium]
LVRAFVLARVVCGERGAGGLTTGELWGAFQSWREENAGAPLTRRQFAVRVRRLLADEFGVGQRCSLKRGGRSARGFSRLQLSDPGRTSLV